MLRGGESHALIEDPERVREEACWGKAVEGRETGACGRQMGSSLRYLQTRLRLLEPKLTLAYEFDYSIWNN